MRLILAFAFSYVFFITAPALLQAKLAAGPTPTTGAVLDLLTPFVLIGLYLLLYKVGKNGWIPGDVRGKGWTGALFTFFAILFVEGHGMHLSANSIGSFLGESRGSEAYAIAYFYDEVLSHYLWRLGTLGLTVVLLARHWVKGEAHLSWTLLALAALVYGLTYGISAAESQTVSLDLPASAAIAGLFGARWWRERAVPGGLVFAFFGLGYGVAVVALAAWGLYFGGFPQPSEVLAR